jgi:coenzyme F420 hydrogenase subunit beta
VPAALGDDVIAETADVVVGDAWLSEYVRDYRGTSVVLCRTQQMLDLLQEGVRAGQLSLEDIPVEPIIRSQAGALRQRREGLQYRLALCAKRHQWRPQKRVPPDPRAGTMLFRWLQRLRIKLKTLSKEAFLAQEGREGLDLFKRRLRPWVKASHLINMLRHSPTVLKRKLARLIRRPTRVKK